MTFPASTPEQVQALLATLQPVDIDGFHLSAKLVEAGRGWMAGPDGQWHEAPAYEVHFEGGRWGGHVLRCAVSPPERIRAHWEGYIAAHAQHSERVEGLRSVPAGAKFKRPTYWDPKVGDRCFFDRGMYGLWQGTIRRLYQARGHIGCPKGTWLADIAFTGSNGHYYTARRVPVRSLTKNGIHPSIERLK